MLVADLRHYLDLPEGTPAPAVRLGEHLRDIVRAATAGEEGEQWVCAVRCQRRPGHRSCPGNLRVRRTGAPPEITWECTACGDSGAISGWQGTPDDLSAESAPQGTQTKNIRISEELAACLRTIFFLEPDLERVVHRARITRGQLVLAATDDQVEELLEHLAAEANHETNRRRRRRLDAAYDELSSAPRKPTRPVTTGSDDGGSRVAQPGRPTAAAHGLPELDLARVQRWCAARVPDHARDQVRVECEPAARHLTIVERRTPWRAESGSEWTSLPIARLRYAKASGTWTLYWRDRNLRFHLYDRTAPSPHVDDLLAEIDRDPTAIFWG